MVSLQVEVLSKSDLKALTGKVRPTAQSRYLTFMGIDHKFRPDGSLFVLAECVRASMGLTDRSSEVKTTKRVRVKTEGLLGVRVGKRSAAQ